MERSTSVNEYSITIDGKIFQLKIGLRGIIYLQSLSQYDESDVFVASIITLNQLSQLDAKNLYSQAGEDYKSIQPLLGEEVSSFLYTDVRDLYSRAVGEIGINPAVFFQMSPDEVELAYQGYLKKKELEANLTKLAVIQALANDRSQIQIAEPSEYTVGITQEREHTFSRLGM